MKYLSFLFFALLLTSCATTQQKNFPPYDLVLAVSPIQARPIFPGDSFAAFEGTSPDDLNSMRAVVQLEVQDVLMGEYEKVDPVGDSKLEQAKEAAKDGNFWKVLTMDFENPDDEESYKKWITVAVVDPFETFGIRDWDHPASKRHKLYLQSVPDQENTYLLVGVITK